MNKIAFIIDSTCGLAKNLIEKYPIKIARLKIIYKNRECIDGIDITPEEVYENIDIESPTTSMPSVGELSDIYEELITEGYTHVIGFPISSGLSGTINSFKLAAEHYEDKIKSFIFDTKSISLGVALMVTKACEMLDENKDFDYICSKLPELKSKLTVHFTVDTLEYLIKGGRIGRISGGIGQLLHLKPIIDISDEDGKYVTLSKVRGSKNTFNKLVSMFTDILDNHKCKVAIATGTMHEELEKAKEILSNHKNTTSVVTGSLTPAVGVHCGPKLLGIGVLIED